MCEESNHGLKISIIKICRAILFFTQKSVKKNSKQNNCCCLHQVMRIIRKNSKQRGITNKVIRVLYIKVMQTIRNLIKTNYFYLISNPQIDILKVFKGKKRNNSCLVSRKGL